jgi:hypothetical protein
MCEFVSRCEHRFTIIGDHYQFYLEDEYSQADTSALWDDRASRDMFVVASGLIGVGTVRYGGRITVIVDVRAQRPTVSLDQWDHAVLCSIEAPSGRLMIASPESDGTDAPRIVVEPGTYQVVLLYRGLDTVDDDNAADGSDVYHILLWPGRSIRPEILKHRQS